MGEEEVGKSWYTKYRPRTMEEYSGPTIKNIVSKRFQKKENFPHCIYIRGPRGTGKTTFARLITKYYLCLNPHEDGTPCEECEMCQQINDILISGNSIDVECPGVVEVDATTANGKEAITDIMEDAVQAPIYTPYKIIIFDECHMITNQAQNALLKLIEDVPPHLICIFCTTNDEKVLPTIKSRMQLTLEARKQSVKDMANRLMQISEMEHLTVSQQALEVIARKGNRVPRECINILENIAKTYDGEITIDNVKKALGGVSSELYTEYFSAANKSLEDILVFVKKLNTEDVQITKFVSGLMGFVLDSMYIKHGISLEDYPVEYIQAIKQIFEMYNSSDFDMLLQIVETLAGKITVDNDSNNEMMLVITAMRIGKVNLLANGLATEQAEANVENKKSLKNHADSLKKDNRDILEQKLKVDLDLEDVHESFDNIELVKGTSNLLDNIELPELAPIETNNACHNEKLNIGEEVDDFFNN